MNWDLPTYVDVGNERYHITNGCDYRVVLDAFCALNDDELDAEQRAFCALLIFYEELTTENLGSCPHISELINQMFTIMNYGEEADSSEPMSARIMDWEYDFPRIAPAVSQCLGYDVRDPEQVTHWYSFIGGYMEMGECLFATIISVRQKLKKGKPLEKWEREFYQTHKKMVDLPLKLTSEEQEYLDSDW